MQDERDLGPEADDQVRKQERAQDATVFVGRSPRGMRHIQCVGDARKLEQPKVMVEPARRQR